MGPQLSTFQNKINVSGRMRKEVTEFQDKGIMESPFKESRPLPDEWCLLQLLF